jgi:steroid 5-alpha reductase family enzyme
MVAVLAALWSLRLGSHIALRTAHGGDDPRYAALRQEWGAKANIRLFWFLQVQALAALVLVAALIAAADNPAPWPGLGDILGAALVVISILGEGVADRQLDRFRKDANNKGKVCDAGLWRYTRHPNYFFEWLGWLAYPLFAIDPGGAYPWGWLALSGPLCMYWLLVHVSGIPPLEQQMRHSRGEAYRAYQARVSAFIPLPSRRIT